MPISALSAPPPPVPALQASLTQAITDGNRLAEKTGKNSLNSASLQEARGASLPAPTTADTAASAQVTLSPVRATMAQSAAPAPVYAEIWKDGVKVAVIDSRGNVTSPSGLLMPFPGDNPGGSAEQAARRTAQIARAVGGDIRVAGQILDVPTLNMRARLQAAYRV